MDLTDFHTGPNPLAQHYSHFLVDKRILLTGHSHQAWPDVSLIGQTEAWHDAAEHVDEKWSRAMAKAEQVREGFAGLLDDSPEHIALGANTHELLVKLISALPLQSKPKIVTTDGEYHSARRQFQRLEETGVEIVRVAHQDGSQVIEQLIDLVDGQTAMVMVSSVFFLTGEIITGFKSLLDKCSAHDAILVVDVYHQLNVVPFSIREEALEQAYIVGGGYKYCQLGEGNAFLRFPKGCQLRPIITGWFAEFALMSAKPSSRVAYPDGPDRFAGATYDPTPHYRAAKVFEFFKTQHMTPPLLRQISQHQIKLLRDEFDKLGLPEAAMSRNYELSLEQTAGFLALTTPHAKTIHQQLLQHEVYTDYRGDILRLGPAPYLADSQIIEAVEILGRVVRSVA